MPEWEWGGAAGWEGQWEGRGVGVGLHSSRFKQVLTTKPYRFTPKKNEGYIFQWPHPVSPLRSFFFFFKSVILVNNLIQFMRHSPVLSPSERATPVIGSGVHTRASVCMCTHIVSCAHVHVYN